MTFKINRFYYLFSPEYRKNLLIQLVLTLLFLFLAATGGPIGIAVPLGLIALLFYWNLWLILTRPKQIRLVEDHITSYAWFKRDRNSGGVIRFGRVRGVPEYKRVNAVIRRITKIEVTYLGYHQARRVGTIRLYGEIHAKNKHDDFEEDVIIPSHMDFYGVLDVESATEALRNAFPTAELTESGRRAK